MTELNQWREPATTERGDVPQKAPGQFLAAFLVTAFLEQHAAEPLFEAVDSFQRRSFVSAT
jgi:hypothetical protein